MADESCPRCGAPVAEGRINCPECGAAYEDLSSKDFERDPEEQEDL